MTLFLKKRKTSVNSPRTSSTGRKAGKLANLALALSYLSTPQLEALMSECVEKAQAAYPKATEWSPHAPHPGPQQRFIDNVDTKEILYGGAAGGGKTDALLMAALKYVHVPGYKAVIFRRTFPQLNLSSGLIERSKEWLQGKGAKYNQNEHCWTFPSGATIRFAQLQYESTKHGHHGAEYHFIGWDELTQFTETQYKYLFSRCRKPKATAAELALYQRKHPGLMHISEVPLRIRATSNPGDIGHVWVKKRFLSEEGQAKGRLFIEAKLRDNPSLDAESYIENLGELDAVSRARLLDGNWDLMDNCLISFDLVEQAQAQCLWPMGQQPSQVKDLYVGVDIGRTKDLTVIWTFEKVEDLFVCRAIDCMQGAKFREQKEAIKKRLTKQVVACRIDKGGIGMQLAEELAEEYPSKVEGVQLTAGRQGQLAKLIQAEFIEGRVRIPEDAELQEDIQLVRKVGTANGVPVIQTVRGEVGHGDRFWGMALARFAAPYEAPRARGKIGSSPSRIASRTSTNNQPTKARSPIRGRAMAVSERQSSSWRQRRS